MLLPFSPYIPFAILILSSRVVFAFASYVDLYCSSPGFGGIAETILVPRERINDGYCDCPAEGGIDELETDACSGSLDGGWAGLVHINSRYVRTG